MQQTMHPTRLLVLALAFEGGLGLLGLVLAWLFGPIAPEAWFEWSWRSVPLAGVASLPWLLFLLVCMRWPVGPLRRLKDFSEKTVAPLFRNSSTLDLMLISAAAGFGEEALFRGFLQSLLTEWLGVWMGIWTASVVFGLMHPFSMTYILLATLAGAYLGFLFVGTGNLLVPIIVHAVYDLAALLYITSKRSSPIDDNLGSQPCDVPS